RLSLRDTRSRWGSCNSSGDLNFSWRLILAPEHVLDYVVAHEVAHMVHLNHSARFWKLAGLLAQDMAGAKAWMARHGAQLWRYG
ncbi:MAG TPA: M48 family metallopeptidase, partial [Kiloniellaceae bacterium]